ncbi:hypothetical protein [Deinococcus sp. RL]|uniref:hypothetical protein n=1 Tax=Deinococcus sp. RL TaxID=1489678 RepID=UPI000B063D42|nr:hypothetical protein [Deinococcus sp. RL]
MKAPRFLRGHAARAVLEAAHPACPASQLVAQATQNTEVKPPGIYQAVSRLTRAGHLARVKRQGREVYVTTLSGQILLRAMDCGIRASEARVLACLSREPRTFAEVWAGVPDMGRTDLSHRLRDLIALELAERTGHGVYALTDLGEFTLPAARAVLELLEEPCRAAS